jgi:CRISPR-associated protein Cas2
MIMMQILVTYDISDDKARKRISEICLDYGLDRTQYSVFTGQLKPVHIRGLGKSIRPYVKEGYVLIIPISSDDWENRQEIGAEIHHHE